MAHSDMLPDLQCRRPHLGQRICGAAAQHRLDLPTTAHRHIAAHTGSRCMQLQAIAIIERDGRMAADRPARALCAVHGHIYLRPRHRQRGHAVAAQLQLTHEVFQHGRIHRIAHQPVGRVHGGQIQCTRRRDAQARQALPPRILHERLQTYRNNFYSWQRLLYLR